MSDIKKGDRVRITIEGEVTYVTQDGRLRINSATSAEGFAWAPGSEVEKIEPPVEVFKPGDVVKSKRTGEVYYIRPNGGFIIYLTGEPTFESNYQFKFTSKEYEKINLA